jgi:threonine/homoserine/homoserine lactone efflux protein
LVIGELVIEWSFFLRSFLTKGDFLTPMLPTHDLYLFFIASLMLNLTPGNDMLYVASRSLSQGTMAGVFSAIGIFLGCFVHITAAIFGLSIIVAQSAFLFELIKYAGAAYLIYLGIRSLMSKEKTSGDLEKLPSVDQWKLLRQGVITNILNPKVAVFFLSFLPQFADPASPMFKGQLFSLGLWFDVQGTLILIGVAFLLGKSGNFIKRYPNFWSVQKKLTGMILIGLGVKLAVTSRK